MSKKKRKDIPFHIAHDYKQFELTGEHTGSQGRTFGGVKFWAKDGDDAKLYCDKIGWPPLSLEEIKEK